MNNKNQIKLKLIEFGSIKSVPARITEPVLEEIKKKYNDKIEVVFYDVRSEEFASFADKYKINVIPTYIFFDSNGVEISRHEKVIPQEIISQLFKKVGIE